MQHDEDYWHALTESHVRDDGYYWWRDTPGSSPEIIVSTKTFGGSGRSIRFLDDEDYVQYSIEAALRNWPNGRVSAERIKPPMR